MHIKWNILVSTPPRLPLVNNFPFLCNITPAIISSTKSFHFALLPRQHFVNMLVVLKGLQEHMWRDYSFIHPCPQVICLLYCCLLNRCEEGGKGVVIWSHVTCGQHTGASILSTQFNCTLSSAFIDIAMCFAICACEWNTMLWASPTDDAMFTWSSMTKDFCSWHHNIVCISFSTESWGLRH